MPAYVLILLALVAAACSPLAAGPDAVDADTPGALDVAKSAPVESQTKAADNERRTSQPAEEPTPEPEPGLSPTVGERTVDDTEYDIPPPLLPYDAIAPIYDPEFVTVEFSPLRDDELVMGVSIEGESKAYPVTVLRIREMVNDELAGWPILVSW